jgi:SAM-dependent methyltransferase
MQTNYSMITKPYKVGMEITGFTACLEKYVNRLPIVLPYRPAIYDVGCGTGILGISLKNRFPDSNVLATDLEDHFFEDMPDNIKKLASFGGEEFCFGRADINEPEKVILLKNDRKILLEPGTFDVVIVGAALGHAVSSEQSIMKLLKLVKPGGYFIDIEMAENLIGKTLSYHFGYQAPKIKNISSVLKENGCIVKIVPFSLNEISAGLSRVGIISQKIN